MKEDLRRETDGTAVGGDRGVDRQVENPIKTGSVAVERRADHAISAGNAERMTASPSILTDIR
jgi:hypothetical protein